MRAVARRARRSLRGVAIVLAGLLTPLGVQAQSVVNVYNWTDYIAPKVIEDFTRETGIAVKYDTFDSNDTLETKLLAGQSGYDVVVPTAYFLARQIAAGVVQKLDRAKLPNRVHLWDEIERRLATYDPGNQHAVNYMWGTTGIGYNIRKAREILGPDARLDSWDVLFKPDVIRRFKECGVHMLDSADDVFPAVLGYLGRNPDSKAEADLQKAAETLAAIRPFVRKFHSSEYLNALASGEICLVFGFSGDIKQAQKRAAEARNGVDIAYAIPREGTQLWFDNLAIPKDAPNVEAAHAFINFLLRPDIAARNSNFIAYANGNAASRPLLDKAVADDPTIYPDGALMQRLYIVTAPDQKSQRLMNRLWTRLKTGR